MELLNINDIKNLCQELGISPTKDKGQNFLVDEGVLNDILKASDLNKNDVVLEIGPGFGVLTGELAEGAKMVVAVELDRVLFQYLKSRFEGVDNLELVEGDIIRLFNKGLIEGEYKVVANLPYQITSNVLRILLEAENKPSEVVVMVQKEVGERICASQGEMSVLSVMVQYFGEAEIIRVVGRDSFWPVPEVDSAVIRIRVGDREGVDERNFFKVVKIGFSSRRKKLKNNLGNVYDKEKVDQIFIKLGFGENIRAQELDVDDWIKLSKEL